MGKFDKKVNKFEPDAPNSQKVHKKKSNQKLATLESNKSVEKERNMKILTMMQREKDYHAGGEKSQNALNSDKMVKNNKVKEERARAKTNRS